jgi:predicted outer membrane protein
LQKELVMKRYLSVIAISAALGCAGAARQEPVSATTTTTAIIAAGVDPPPVVKVEPKPIETFTDDQILAMLTTFNTGELELTALVPDRSRDPGVKRFATVLQKDHTIARDQETRLSERLVMKPVTTDRMREMQTETAKEVDKLRAMSGHDFDVEFVTNQVDRQRDCLAMIDLQLVPSARIPEIRSHLASIREDIDHHLRDGESLKRSLGGPIIAASPTPTTTK